MFQKKKLYQDANGMVRSRHLNRAPVKEVKEPAPQPETSKPPAAKIPLDTASETAAKSHASPIQPNLWAAIIATGWRGLILFTGVILLIIYLVGGLVVYAGGPGNGAAKAVPVLYSWMPSARIVLHNSSQAYHLWQVLSVLFGGGVIASLFCLLARRRISRLIVAGIVVLTFGLGAWSVPHYNHWYVGYNDYVHRYQSLKRLKIKQAQLVQGSSASDDASLRTQAMQQVIVFKYITQEAAKYKIVVSQSDIMSAYNKSVTSAGSETALKKQLQDYLGWSTDDFKQDIRQRLLQEQLNLALAATYKREAEASRKDLQSTNVRIYVAGLKWDTKLLNVLPK